MNIAAAEHFNIEPTAVEALVSSTNGDIRQIINALMMWRVSSSIGPGGGRGAVLTGSCACSFTAPDSSPRLRPAIA